MTVISIPDMSCGHCSTAVTQALTPLAQSIEINLETRQAQVTTQAPPEALLAALDAVGFPAKILSA